MGCAPTYTHGCSTESHGVTTHGSITVREFGNPYQAAKGRRVLEWCEVEVNGKRLESPSGSRVAQGCSVSPDATVEAVTYSWQHEMGTSDPTLLEVVGGRQVKHALHHGGESGWLAGGKLYVSGGVVFDLVHHTQVDFHRKDLWQFDPAPDDSAVAAHVAFQGPTAEFLFVRLGDGVVHSQKLACADHPWLNPPFPKPVPVEEHTHWVKRPDGAYDLVIDP